MKAKSVTVIGAGPAGLMAAIEAAVNGAEVTVLEKNSILSKKLLITGKGRCNITNNCDIDTFISNIPTNGRFLYSAVNAFTPRDAIEFFENLGVKTKTERGNRVFPVSDKAYDVAQALQKNAKELGCKIIQAQVKALVIEDGVLIGCKDINSNTYKSDSVIIACGGMSYPLTGSTGDGYKLAKQAGHTVTDLSPSLVPLECQEKFCKDMQGLSLKNVRVTVFDNFSKKSVYNDFGELLFTHFGLSGPTILSASCHMKNIQSGKYSIIIDLKPALDDNQLDRRLQRDFQENINKAVSNSLSRLLPRKMIPVVLKLWNVPFDKKCNVITKEERQRLVSILKSFTVTVTKFRPIEEAIITSGGVKTSEINPKTMQSKLLDNLYFAGEVIDVDGYTGGFNLQIAYSTGVLSGRNSAL